MSKRAGQFERRKRGSGKGIKFLNHALSMETDECIPWPYYIMKNGYGQIGMHDGCHLAHRIVCKIVHGEPPEGHQAAHNCGNRACINKRHLRWATQAENEEDKIRHGTWFMRMGGAKLSEEKVKAIRADAALGISHEEISSRYSTPLSTIQKVVKRYTWKHVD